ncbi:hypothetical protein DFW101_1941 [Solidesulfovibrio carbinoliphilus subsp. oakridgensis]|uniref:Anti-bacteriophage protein A/HamA C-terminal domain-containing protein n=1 Tax=Solidesulfovibrio carbinoliphilus subsp. oakridgensis TaxID=694327 RepID=G7Q520_9BACT|nr:Hachiman antiphage defense system protein HamA [Solidesulfovibrio carbinoliphilus]EHJ47947.1 hypothetical protein DFW101_1941 [Solidesulfovibrio carbinoliphilus subsp. oakridgensis]
MFGFNHFISLSRVALKSTTSTVRDVFISDVKRVHKQHQVEKYIADRTPLFYRDFEKIVQAMNPFFVTTLVDTLQKLPTSESFQESHFGEIVSAIFAEEIVGLKIIYNKLSLLTSENANAYKMDLVLYDPSQDPIDIIFGEVKSSPKVVLDSIPANHHKSCYPDMFRSLNNYTDRDLNFDLGAAKDRIEASEDKDRLKAVLMPYSGMEIKYVGFAVVDHSSKSDDEIKMLGSRSCNKNLVSIDVVCVENYPEVAANVFKKLEAIKSACLL